MRKIHRQEGQSALEFALALPFLIAFVIFIVDAGLLLFGYVSVTNAVREGARCGVVGGDDSAVEERVQDAATDIVVLDSVVVTERGDDIGENITVEATYTYDWILPVGIIPGLSIDNHTYTRSATMRLETNDFDITECGT